MKTPLKRGAAWGSAGSHRQQAARAQDSEARLDVGEGAAEARDVLQRWLSRRGGGARGTRRTAPYAALGDSDETGWRGARAAAGEEGRKRRVG